VINLHSHLEGRVRPATAAELSGHDGWERALELDGPADLTVCLAKVASTYPLFGTPEALFRIAQEAVEDAAADSGLVVEVCPSSNWFTGAIADIRDHPAPRFAEAGVRLVAGDDNPRQTLSLLSNELRILSDELGVDTAAIDAMSLESAFLTQGQREQLTAS
jgi:adenosine deaminase